MQNHVINTATLLCFMILITISVAGVHAADASKSPKALIDNYAEKTLEIYHDTDLWSKQNLDPFRESLFDLLAPIVDFRRMAQSTLGPHARSISKSELTKFVSVFKPFVVRIYTDQLISYTIKSENPWNLKKITVEEQELRFKGRFALVKTNAVVSRNETVRTLQMNFKLHKTTNGWRVYDLVFENLSLVENYKAQFTDVLANNSVDSLLEILRKKLASIQNEPVKSKQWSE